MKNEFASPQSKRTFEKKTFQGPLPQKRKVKAGIKKVLKCTLECKLECEHSTLAIQRIRILTVRKSKI